MHSLANQNQSQNEKKLKKKKVSKGESEPLSEQRRRELEHYLKLKRYDTIQPFQQEVLANL